MVELMLDLNGHFRVLFESNWRCTKKWQRGCTWRFTWFKHEHVSAVESAPDGLSDNTYIWGCTLGCNWVTFEDTHGGALVSAKKFTKQFNERWIWGGTLCRTLSCT